MSNQIHGKYTQPTDIQEAVLGADQAPNTEDPSTQTITMLALESLTMGSEESMPEGEIKASLDFNELESTENIENVRSELFGKVDSEMDDLAAMLGLDMDEVEDILNNDDLVSMLEIDEAGLEEFQELIFEGAMPETIELSDEQFHQRSSLSENIQVVVEDPNSGEASWRYLDDPYVVQHPEFIKVVLDGKQLKAKNSDISRLLDLIKNNEVTFHQDMKPEDIESLKKMEFEVIGLSDGEWNSYVKELYLDVLGIRIDDLAQKTFEKTEQTEKGSPSIGAYSIREAQVVNETDRPDLEVSVILPTLFINGVFSKLLNDIQTALNKINEIQKNEEKQEIQRQVLINFLKLKRLQFELLLKSGKKEKIWFENTTSFLRFLMRRDIKVITTQSRAKTTFPSQAA